MTAELTGLQDGIRIVSQFLWSHGGGVELVDVRGDVARIRFIGMCAGCPLRPVTMERVVRPLMKKLSGVVRVEADGARISEEAERRLQLHLARANPGSRMTTSVGRTHELDFNPKHRAGPTGGSGDHKGKIS